MYSTIPHYQILLIEDHPGDVGLIQEYLKDIQSFTWQLFHSDTLRGGMQKLREERIDIVLLDLGLPDSFGRKTILTLLEHFPGINVVVITASGDSKTGLWAIEKGAQDYLLNHCLESYELERVISYSIRRHERIKRMHALLEELDSSLSKAREGLDERQYPRLVADAADGKISQWNEAALELLKLEESALKKMNITDIFSDSDNYRRMRQHISISGTFKDQEAIVSRGENER